MVLFKASPFTWAPDAILSFTYLRAPILQQFLFLQCQICCDIPTIQCKTSSSTSILLQLYFSVPFKLNSKKELSYNALYFWFSLFSLQLIAITLSSLLLQWNHSPNNLCISEPNSKYWIRTFFLPTIRLHCSLSLKHFYLTQFSCLLPGHNFPICCFSASHATSSPSFWLLNTQWLKT